MNEFEIITQFFAKHQHTQRADVLLGIGDDCAILETPQDQHLLVSVDTLVSGVHFPLNTQPYDIGYKALAVNLSDLAAMGANPSWFSLAITLPGIDESWLAGFSEGLFSLAQQFNVQLIGGDTTRGPLSISIQAHGFAPKGRSITRKGAQPDDLLYVTNTLGDAGLALQHILNHRELTPDVFFLLEPRLNRPMPRVKEGLLLRDYATSMIDLSDGLVSDLGHILKQSNVGAVVDVDKLPLSATLENAVGLDEAVKLALSAGDDYELCFTIPARRQEEMQHWLHKEHCDVHCIGHITAAKGLYFQQGAKRVALDMLHGYSHF
jgi:thiamine-monophosphate kinase